MRPVYVLLPILSILIMELKDWIWISKSASEAYLILVIFKFSLLKLNGSMIWLEVSK